MADNYILKVTAGPSYTDQSPLSPNTSLPHQIQSSKISASLLIRIQNYRGLPASSPTTSPYFSSSQHQHDLYSLEFHFTLKDHSINGHDLVFGNDFDHPIRDKLPPGFGQAFQAVKWFVDPGLYGDVYADEPYLYGPLLSSMNVFRVGGMEDEVQERVEEERNQRPEEGCLEEGADGDGEDVRKSVGMPGDAAGRKKHFLTEKHLREFTFEKGREYGNDFFNPYLDFNEFSLKLPGWGMIPGITIPIISYWDGQPLRYVLKERDAAEPLMVIVFTLVPKEEAGKTNQEESKEERSGDDDLD